MAKIFEKAKEKREKGAEKLRKLAIQQCYLELEELDPKSEEYADVVERLTELKGLKNQSRIDPNVVIKTSAIVLLTLGTELVEIPGNLVNLRAIKAIDPVVKLLKL